MKKFLISSFCSLLAANALFAGTLRIAAAANISYPLKEISEEFNRQFPTIKLQVSTGASGGFNAQIKQGADFDVFLSADMGFAQDLEGLAKSKAKPYTQGVLMLFSPVHKNIKLEDLKSAKCLAIANEATAPYGKAALELLKNEGINASKIIVRAPTIAATLSTTLSACEYGMVAKSAALALKEKGFSDDQMLELSGYEPILQGLIVLKDSPDARKFVDFIGSSEAKAIFKKYGYK